MTTEAKDAVASSSLEALKDVARYSTTNYPGTLLAVIVSSLIFAVGGWSFLSRGLSAMCEDAAASAIYTLPDVQAYEAARKDSGSVIGTAVVKVTRFFADVLSKASDEIIRSAAEKPQSEAPPSGMTGQSSTSTQEADKSRGQEEQMKRFIESTEGSSQVKSP